MSHEKVYLVTDGCMWEINKQSGNEHPHAMEVVDIETGAVRYIRSGSKIRFIEGQISDTRTQEAYNKATSKKVPDNGQSVQKRTRSKRSGKTDETPSV